MKNKKHFYLFLVVLWAIVICILLFAPSSAFSHEPKFINFTGADKIVHFILFATFSFLLYKEIQLKQKYNHKTISKFILSVVTIFGLTTEVIQGLTFCTLKRNFSLWDLLTDILSCIFIILCFYIKNKRKSQKHYK